MYMYRCTDSVVDSTWLTNELILHVVEKHCDQQPSWVKQTFKGHNLTIAYRLVTTVPRRACEYWSHTQHGLLDIKHASGHVFYAFQAHANITLHFSCAHIQNSANTFILKTIHNSKRLITQLGKKGGAPRFKKNPIASFIKISRGFPNFQVQKFYRSAIELELCNLLQRNDIRFHWQYKVMLIGLCWLLLVNYKRVPIVCDPLSENPLFSHIP